MDKEEKWLDCYKEIYAFVKQNHRGPSKHRVEEHRMVNWMKYNRKKLNSNKLVDKERTRFFEVGKSYPFFQQGQPVLLSSNLHPITILQIYPLPCVWAGLFGQTHSLHHLHCFLQGMCCILYW